MAQSNKAQKELFFGSLPKKSKPGSPQSEVDTKSGAMEQLLADMTILKDALRDLVEIKKTTTAIDTRTQSICEEMKSFQAQLNESAQRMDEAEQRIGVLEESSVNVQRMQLEIKMLKEQNVQLENYNRRSNIRILGVPEGTERNTMEVFLEQWLPKLLKHSFDPPLSVQRAHRVRTRYPQKSNTPRPIVAYLLYYQHVKVILDQSKKQGAYEYAGQKINITPDFAKETILLRKRFLEQRPALRKLNARFGLLNPARMLVSIGEQTWDFTDPEELREFIRSRSSLPMEIAQQRSPVSQPDRPQRYQRPERRSKDARSARSERSHSSDNPLVSRGGGRATSPDPGPSRRDESRSPLKKIPP